MDMFNYCTVCNPETRWLELEFVSENDVPIDGLNVTIMQNTVSDFYTQTTVMGKVRFDRIPAGEWRVLVSLESLLQEVEKYPGRRNGVETPVKARALSELDTLERAKRYCLTTIGDFWSQLPDDEFLQEHHKGLYRTDTKMGFRVGTDASYVFEVKALRSYLPLIMDTDEFNLVNSYTFALLSKLAYATNEFNRDDGLSTDNQGAIGTIVTQLKSREIPAHAGDLSVQWLLQDIPYSKALDAMYYADDDVGSEGYILSNQDIVIIGVRGTEPYIQSKTPPSNNAKWQIVKTVTGLHAALVSQIESAANSSAMKDLVITDLDSAQIAPQEFGGAYIHRGFYQYTMALLSQMEKDLDTHRYKKFYVCGHSLGGAGALLLSALIKDKYNPPQLCLYTYGMPRTGTRSFVERYQDIPHYRHVNNHDLVPQIPMTWVNTDTSEGLNGWDVFSSGITLVKKMLTDNDDDHYLHHGQLSQLLTYQDPKQILLTPRQTQVTMCDMAKLATNDSVALMAHLTEASVVEHGMDQYIPNLWQQLCALSDDSLMASYQRAITVLDQEIEALQQSYVVAKDAWSNSLSDWTPSQSKQTRLKNEMEAIRQLANNLNQVRGELKQIVADPVRLPLMRLLVAQQALPDDIKDQLQ